MNWGALFRFRKENWKRGNSRLHLVYLQSLTRCLLKTCVVLQAIWFLPVVPGVFCLLLRTGKANFLSRALSYVFPMLFLPIHPTSVWCEEDKPQHQEVCHTLLGRYGHLLLGDMLKFLEISSVGERAANSLKMERNTTALSFIHLHLHDKAPS